jgi:hypothetical protein
MAKNQGEPRYQVPRELADSLAFRSLPNASKVLWHDLMMSYRGRNNGNINATLHDLTRYGWKSPATLAKSLAFLIAHGFLVETRKGGGNSCTLRQCCLYRFTHLPTNANEDIGVKAWGATYDYRLFDPTKLPETITLTSLKGLSGKNSCFGKRSVTLQKVKRHASDNEVCKVTTLQKVKHEKVVKMPASRTTQGMEACL